jgi:hypothetical protein
MRASYVRLFAIVVGTLLTGCATQAQRQSQVIQTNTQTTVVQFQACVTALYNSSDMESLRAHIPLDVRQATLQQLTDPSKVSDVEIGAIYVVQPRYQECRQAMLDGLSVTTPTLIPIMVSSIDRTDDSLIDLIQRKISWGEHVRRRKEVAADLQRDITAEGQRIAAGLQQSHEAELARRQAVADALARYAQTQALINSMNNAANRPVLTNCTRVGNTVNCVTQ